MPTTRTVLSAFWRSHSRYLCGVFYSSNPECLNYGPRTDPIPATSRWHGNFTYPFRQKINLTRGRPEEKS